MSTVSNWGETCAHLVAAHPGAVRASEDALTLAVRIDADGLTAHPVEVRAIDVAGAPWVEVLGLIGPPRLASPAWLLDRNRGGAIGVRCMKRGELAFRQTLPQRNLSLAMLDEVVLAVAYHCADARRRLREAAPRPERSDDD